MKSPSIINLTYEWQHSLTDVTTCVNGKWVPARPLGYPSLRYRIRAAWLVLTGRADALIWPGDVP